jgi:anti-anti-sigma factor
MTDSIDLQQHADYALLTCSGDLDLHLADELRRVISAATRSGARMLVVDLSRTGLVDSTTLGVLLHAHTACREAGCVLVLSGAPRIVARSMSLTGLDRVLTLAPDVETALLVGAGG